MLNTEEMFNAKDLQVFDMPLGWERHDALGEVFHPKLAAIQFKIEGLINQIYGVDLSKRYRRSCLPTSSQGSSGYSGAKHRSDKPYNAARNEADTSCVTLRGKGKACIPSANGGVAKQHFGIFGAYLNKFADDEIYLGTMLMPYVYFRYEQRIRDEFVRTAKRHRLFKLAEYNMNFIAYPNDGPLETVFSHDRAYAFFHYFNPLKALPSDYAKMVILAASVFPLFDVFTRLCSDPKLPIEQDYYSQYISWYPSASADEYIANFSIEPISDEGYWKSEGETRRIFQELFNVEFPKSRPAWLKSGKNTSLELDGYNEDLKLAFEYQGEYHYMEVPVHQQTRSLAEIQKVDELKKALCAKHDVALIQVPYWEKGNIQFVREMAEKAGKQIPKS